MRSRARIAQSSYHPGEQLVAREERHHARRIAVAVHARDQVERLSQLVQVGPHVRLESDRGAIGVQEARHAALRVQHGPAQAGQGAGVGGVGPEDARDVDATTAPVQRQHRGQSLLAVPELDLVTGCGQAPATQES